MTVITLELPAMYGDHHVVEVRRILFELKGVEEVYASSGFHAAEIAFDDKAIREEDIVAKLEAAGYIGGLSIPEETEIPANESKPSELFYRHTEAYAQTSRVVSFGQSVGYEGRALWPCPGMSPITSMAEE